MNTDHFRHRLQEQKERLVRDLEKLGRQDSRDPENWEGKQPDLNILESDRNENADEQEEYHESSIKTEELEAELREVNDALDRIEAGSFGTCIIGAGTDTEHAIEEERLEANPSARTCKEHIDTHV